MMMMIIDNDDDDDGDDDNDVIRSEVGGGWSECQMLNGCHPEYKWPLNNLRQQKIYL